MINPLNADHAAPSRVNLDLKAAAPNPAQAEAYTDLAKKDLHKTEDKPADDWNADANPEETKLSVDHPLINSLNKCLTGIYHKYQSKIDWIDKTLLDDKSVFRKALSLENELAEALEPSMKQLKAPEAATKFVYRLLWGVCWFNTATRTMIESLKSGNVVHGLKKLTQDLISVVGLTTIFARAINWLQDKLCDSAHIPTLVKNILRPVLTVGTCMKAIDYFDKYAGIPGGNLVVKGVERLLAAPKKVPELQTL